MRPLFFVPVTCLTALAATSAFAAGIAQAVPDAGSLLNQQQRQQQRLPDRLPEAEHAPVSAPPQQTTGLKVQVVAIHFSGATHLATEAEMQAVVADRIGQELDFAGIEQLVTRVTAFLHHKGWFLARAYLPRQDVTGGQIEIGLLEGHLDGREGKSEPYTIVPDNKMPLRIAPERLHAIAANLLPAGTPAQEGDLERALLLMNDLPGMTAKASLQPGTEPDSTRVILDVQEGPLLSGNGWVDNYGNRDTGSTQANLAGALNDPFGSGDQVGLSGTATQGLKLGRFSYTLPLGSTGTKLNGSISDMSYKVIRGVGQTAGLTGSSGTGSLTLSQPFVRSRHDNLYGSFGYTYKTLWDDAQAGPLHDKRLDNWNTGLSGNRLDELGGGGLTSGNLTWTTGRVDLGHLPTDAAADAAGYATQGRFNKTRYPLRLSAIHLTQVSDACTIPAWRPPDTQSQGLTTHGPCR
ncbi:MAG: ShlB/FhaC/HecB family hemolysin secretion/activation protein, partial [Magnetococcales bacterium]|nr:ShlB/FhaC/HecB family hemolysin secretion/activation protein [Magnetococcales bacterium]